jgi:ABC-type uncharacterized transport system permease subunit
VGAPATSTTPPARRGHGGWGWRHVLYYGAPLWALLLAGAVVTLLLVLSDAGLRTAYSALYDGALGTRYSVGLSLTRSVPLIFTGLAVAFAYRCGLFNIGAEGQLQMGGLATAVVGVATGSLVAAILAGFLAGAAWCGLPGLAKARLGVNEIISTLMLNFVAITLVVIVIGGPFSDESAAYSTSPTVPPQFGSLLSESPLHTGFLLALAVVGAVAYVLYRTPLGFRVRAVGLNADAARHAGLGVGRTIVVAMVLSGGLAGLAGAVEVLGVQHRVATDWSAGWGFTGIAVAFLARCNPLAVVVVALLYGALDAGAENMQFATGVPGALIAVAEGLPILFLVAIVSRARPASRARPSDPEPAARSVAPLEEARS